MSKRLSIGNRTLVYTAITAIIAAALIQREANRAGYWLFIAALLFYLANKAPLLVRGLKRFRSLDPHDKWRIVSLCALTAVCVFSLADSSAHYIPALIVLGIEYYYCIEKGPA